jgi:rhodanese-related sulfurtransferase
MKLFRTFSVLLLTIFSMAAYSQAKPYQALNLVDALKENRAPILLDVRTPAEFQSGHIAGAINIPFDQLPQRIKEISQFKQQEVVVYCRSGRRAEVATDTLESEGFTQLYDLTGHMIAWNKNNYPVIAQ